MLNRALKMAALFGGLLVPGVAAAAAPAIVTTDLNFRTGPGTAYHAFDVIPEGGNVTVYGCLSGYNWCDIRWSGDRGWVSGKYLAYVGERYYRKPIASIGISIGLPIVGYDRDYYYDRWYSDRDWYRAIRREIREERPEDRREVRQERREDRREFRQERREDRRNVRSERRDVQDARQDLRQARRSGDEDLSDERRKLRQERRELRQAQRDRRN
jgi:uncharacterized protein YraI